MMKDLRQWASKVVERHPQVLFILLAGSRARGDHRPDSDYDIVIGLEDESYAHGRCDKGEFEVLFDKEIHFEGLDMWFLRPDGQVIAWREFNANPSEGAEYEFRPCAGKTHGPHVELYNRPNL